MIQHLVLIFLSFVFLNPVWAASIVDTNTITISGISAFEGGTVYGGVAGTCTGDGVSPCNSCTNTSTPPKACNQSNIYGSLAFQIQFKTSAARNNAMAQILIESTPLIVNPETKNWTSGETVVLNTTWAAICSAMGVANLDGNCNISGLSQIVGSKTIKFGIAAEGGGTLADAEASTLQLKFHGIPSGASDVTQTLCADSGGGFGACNLTFVAGDGKAFIDAAIFNPTEPGGTAWDSIAIFPIATPNGGESNAYTSFTSGAVSPTFKKIDNDGTIPDSQVGGLANYQKYCLVYGMKNKAQNIYKFVNDPAAASAGCITPSVVVGILDDKRCFISTAAFGSSDMSEVETFRKFRDQFLVTNNLGKAFVGFYYDMSPPIANMISGSEPLKALTRGLLYPFLLFATMALQIGFVWAIVLSLGTVIGLVTAFRILRFRSVLMVMLLVLVSPHLKADLLSTEEKIDHPNAKEGLIRIKKDGTYVYDVKRTPKNQSSHLRFGQANQPQITIGIEQTDASGNPTGTFKEYSFEDFYGSASGVIIGYDYEWFPWGMEGDGGRLGVQAGGAGMFVTGNGRLVADPDTQSKESYTFVTLPLNLGAVYRLEWKEQQMFVPYVSGGGTYLVLLEKREDKAMPSATGGFGFYGAGGILFNLNTFDREAGLKLDSEYGIGNLWLSLEFRVTEVQNAAFGFSNRYVNAGLSFDF
ncbi:CFI-box-CTERM domain-containing protein [Pseudobdellovibrio exovorus]|uniref:Outer membrane protein beta-barrel domain-containing protein n=1 Tax=Pseudobdellovibrio exovorus JSS TaxID=1184267 RepID=M4VNS0_9BACT|nr:CFI-box-CTERM domain-containing protein [Pseudobdellovibrio exovorus]AGH94764.1 hypothetical protein A11Q_544 [Pseudobdellovibrio exovorus JSS]